jgi:hypothetical protein
VREWWDLEAERRRIGKCRRRERDEMRDERKTGEIRQQEATPKKL